MSRKTNKAVILSELGDGLVLRRSTRADAEALASFNASLHSDDGPDKPDEKLGAWTHDLLTLPHPSFDAGDFTIVEDTRSGAIVSSLNIIPQVWTYAGVQFKVGRPELVGTLPEYRNRGLVRLQFETIHAWSAARGEVLQAITGIPYYYRQFGYEMALDLGGGRLGYLPHIPKLKDDEQEPYIIRPARLNDLPFISELYDLGCRRSLVSCIWGEAEWRYELQGKSQKNINRAELRVIETAGGEAVGFIAHPYSNWAKGVTLPAYLYELKPGVSWAQVTPSVLRYLKSTGEEYAGQLGKEPFGAFGFWLGAEHPVYGVLKDRLPRVREPYAWYLRLPDLPGFVQHIQPVLQARLDASAYAGHTGELKLTFYRQGLKLVLEGGTIAAVEPWSPVPLGHSGNAGFPGLTFLQLLFGYRSFEQLEVAFADCWSENDDASGLLETLFPRQASCVWPVS
jgi:hypothetical protein